MRSLPWTLAVAATIVVVTGTPSPAEAQGTLDAATDLYASAAYDDALAMLDRLPVDGLDVTTRVTIDHYRMLCLLALGRTDDAERAIARLLELHPAYTLGEDDASPRVVKVFLEVRGRVLPEMIRRRFDAAQALQVKGDHAGAVTAFAVVRALLADAGMAGSEGALSELAQQAARGEASSREALEAGERRAALDAAVAAAARDDLARAAASPPAEPVPPPTAAAPPTPAPPPVPADGIYTANDRGVVAPVALRQEVRRWFGPMTPPTAGTPLGQVQFVIDETGAVTDLGVVASVSAFYDAVVIESVRTWRYQPATRDGVPVKFRRVISLVSR